MDAIKAAIGDTVLTFMWVFCASTLGVLTTSIANAVGVQGLLWPSLLITTILVFVLVFIFALIGDALGGASFNPTGTAAFYAAGLGPDTLFSMALRFPAQVPPLLSLFFFFNSDSTWDLSRVFYFVGMNLRFFFFFGS